MQGSLQCVTKSEGARSKQASQRPKRVTREILSILPARNYYYSPPVWVLAKPVSLNKITYEEDTSAHSDQVAFWGGVAEAQAPAKVPRIGFLHVGSPDNPRTPGFRQGLREVGYVEGQNITVEYRFAKGRRDLLAKLAPELVGLKCQPGAAGRERHGGHRHLWPRVPCQVFRIAERGGPFGRENRRPLEPGKRRDAGRVEGHAGRCPGAGRDASPRETF